MCRQSLARPASEHVRARAASSTHSRTASVTPVKTEGVTVGMGERYDVTLTLGATLSFEM